MRPLTHCLLKVFVALAIAVAGWLNYLDGKAAWTLWAMLALAAGIAALSVAEFRGARRREQQAAPAAGK